MTMYIDIILLENICMNYIILFATGIIIKNKISYIRLFLASSLGAVYSILAYMNIFQIYSTLIIKIVLSVVIVYLAFNAKSFKILLKEIVIFYLTSFTFGGVAFALLYIVKPQDILMRNGLYIGEYPLKIAILGGIIGAIIIVIAFKIIKGKMSKKDMYCNIEISINNKKVEVKAIIDTGNLLKDPISGMPVIIVESENFKDIIPYDLINNIEKIIGGEIILDDEMYISKLRLIPFSSLGKENGMLLGLKADYIKIENQIKENIIIAIYPKTLTKSRNYTALVGLDVLELSNDSYFYKNAKLKI